MLFFQLQHNGQPISSMIQLLYHLLINNRFQFRSDDFPTARTAFIVQPFRAAELDGRKQELLARIAELTVEAISPEQVSQISG